MEERKPTADSTWSRSWEPSKYLFNSVVWLTTLAVGFPKHVLFLLAVSPLLTRGAVLFTRYYVYQTQNHVSSWSYIPPVQLWNSFNMYRIRNTELVDFSLELWIMDDVSRAITKVATLWGERRGAVLWIQHLWSSHCGWYFCFGSAFQI